MTEGLTKTPNEIARRETAIDIIGSFRSVAPLTEPNATEYLSWLDLVEGELDRATVKNTRGRNKYVFFVPSNRAIELHFTPDSITWTWENGRDGHTTKRSVKFFLVDEKPQLKLTLEEFKNREKRKKREPSSATSITIADEETVLVSVNGEEEEALLEDVTHLFPKPTH